MNRPSPVVSVNHFSMQFSDKIVIKDLSFDVRQGETFGLLGSNGSGKTTTIRALLGIYRPSSGTLLVNSQPYRVDGDILLGYLPEERGLYKKEKVIDTMIYFGQLKGLSRSAARSWSMDYLRRVHLEAEAVLRLDKLSGGMQQKVQVGIAVMGNPQLLILDEPAKGFDPVNRRLLMDIIEEHQETGATVIFVTHQMEEVERLCDRVLLLKDGQANLYGTIDEIKDKFGGKIIEVVAAKPLPKRPELYRIQRTEGHTTILEPLATMLSIQKSFVDAGIAIAKFELKRPSLDDIFVTAYGQKAQEESHA